MKERVGSLPGVAGVGTIDILPLRSSTRFYMDTDRFSATPRTGEQGEYSCG